MHNAPARALALALLAASAGCVGDAARPAAPAAATAAEHAAWGPGSWWSYHVELKNVTFDVALVVHEATEDGYRLGSNLSAGFFGLPFRGNVTPERNPVVTGEEWPLFRFPLHEGKSWTYRMLGHEARTVAHEAVVGVPGGAVDGYRLESTSYGRLFARYEYAPDAGWLTRFELIEPTDGSHVLTATLTGHGSGYDATYYVERVVREARVPYPALPGVLALDVPDDDGRYHAVLRATAGAGAIDATLSDARGRELAHARAVAGGSDERRAALERGSRVVLDHAGVGGGEVLVEIVGVVEAGRASQSTRPVVPQTGHVTSIAWPVAV